MGAKPPEPVIFGVPLVERYRKVRALAERGGTDEEKATAGRVLDALEEEHAGLGAFVRQLDEEPKVRRRASAPPGATPWQPPPPPPAPAYREPSRPHYSARNDHMPGSHGGFTPGYNPHAPPPGFGAGGPQIVWQDPDAFSGRPWERRDHRAAPQSAPGQSRWAAPPENGFAPDGSLPPGYGQDFAPDGTYIGPLPPYRRR